MAEFFVTDCRATASPIRTWTQDLGGTRKVITVFRSSCPRCEAAFAVGDRIVVTDDSMRHRKCPDAS